MKRLSTRQTIYLCLPLLLAGTAAVSVRNAREKVRVFYSQPFTPQLKLVRDNVPRVPGLFAAQVRCIATGGRGQTKWLVRGQLFDLSQGKQYRIWSTDNRMSPERVTFIMGNPTRFDVGIPPSLGTSSETGFSWRFSRDIKVTPRLKFVAEAVALSNSMNGDPQNMGQSVNIGEATEGNLAAARELPGARYFRQSLVLDANDDGNYLYPLGQ